MYEPFLLMFESRVKRHSFCGIETLNGYIYSAGSRVVNGPPGRGLIVIYARSLCILTLVRSLLSY